MDKRIPGKVCLDIGSKDARWLRFAFPTDDKEHVCDHAMSVIEAYAFPVEDRHIFAFCHKYTDREVEGWNVFADVEEYARMGLDWTSKVRSQTRVHRVPSSGCL